MLSLRKRIIAIVLIVAMMVSTSGFSTLAVSISQVVYSATSTRNEFKEEKSTKYYDMLKEERQTLLLNDGDSVDSQLDSNDKAGDNSIGFDITKFLDEHADDNGKSLGDELDVIRERNDNTIVTKKENINDNENSPEGAEKEKASKKNNEEEPENDNENKTDDADNQNKTDAENNNENKNDNAVTTSSETENDTGNIGNAEDDALNNETATLSDAEDNANVEVKVNEVKDTKSTESDARLLGSLDGLSEEELEKYLAGLEDANGNALDKGQIDALLNMKGWSYPRNAENVRDYNMPASVVKVTGPVDWDHIYKLQPQNVKNSCYKSVWDNTNKKRNYYDIFLQPSASNWINELGLQSYGSNIDTIWLVGRNGWCYDQVRSDESSRFKFDDYNYIESIFYADGNHMSDAAKAFKNACGYRASDYLRTKVWQRKSDGKYLITIFSYQYFDLGNLIIEMKDFTIKNTWYKDFGFTTPKSDIHKIKFVKGDVSTSGATEVKYLLNSGAWGYATDKGYCIRKNTSGGTYKIYGVIKDNTLTISIPNDTSFKVYLDSNLSKFFSNADNKGNFTSLTSVEGMGSLIINNTANMSAMFNNCTALTSVDLSMFNTSSVTNMSSMFEGCSALTSINFGNNFDTSKVQYMQSMFKNCKAIENINFGSKFNTAKVSNMANMFDGCEKLKSVDLSKFNSAALTSVVAMFANCKALTSVTMGNNFTLANVTNMSSMFSNCQSIEKINLNKVTAAKATNTTSMFDKCPNLAEIDLSSFNTANLTDMSYMFRDCTVLDTIYASDKFVTNKVTKTTSHLNVFINCNELVGGEGTEYDTDHIDKEYARLDKRISTGVKGYFTLTGQGGDKHRHKECGVGGTVTCTHGDPTHNQAIRYIQLDNTNIEACINGTGDFADSKNNIYLTSDITLPGTGVLTLARDVNICLNGHSLKGTFKNADGKNYKVSITNCRETVSRVYSDNDVLFDDVAFSAYGLDVNGTNNVLLESNHGVVKINSDSITNQVYLYNVDIDKKSKDSIGDFNSTTTNTVVIEKVEFINSYTGDDNEALFTSHDKADEYKLRNMTIENKVGPTLIDAPSSTLKVETNIKIDNYEVRGNKLISVGNAIINSGVKLTLTNNKMPLRLDSEQVLLNVTNKLTIDGDFEVTGNRVNCNGISNRELLAAVKVEQIDVAGGTVLVRDNNAIDSDNTLSRVYHMFGLYSTLTNDALPLFKQKSGTVFNANSVLENIAFDREDGRGLVIENWTSTTAANDTIYETIFIPDTIRDEDIELQKTDRNDIYVVSARRYTVTLDAHGGSFSQGYIIKEEKVTYGEDIRHFEIPRREGYLFNGYQVATNSEVIDLDRVWPFRSSETAVAKWKANTYKIRFVSDHATSGIMIDQTMRYDEERELDDNLYKRDGYDFDGWDYNGQPYGDKTPVSNLSVKNNDIVYFKAKWTPKTYTIEYHSNFGEGEADTVITEGPITYGERHRLQNLAFTRDNSYAFIGWAVDSSTSEARYSDGFVLDGDEGYSPVIKLYAKWVQNATAYYVVKENKDEYDDQQVFVFVKSNESIVMPKVEREGYEIAGYSTDRRGLYPYEIPRRPDFTGEKVLFIQWKPKEYRVIYHSNDGEYKLSSETKAYNQNVTLTNASAFSWTRAGYNFSRWSTQSKAFGTEYDTVTSYSPLTTKDKIDLFAIWEKKQVTIKYHANGGEGTMPDEVFTYDEDEVLSTNIFTSNNQYVFSGWAENSTDTSIKYIDGHEVNEIISNNPNKTVIDLYAVWILKKDVVKVSYDPKGGRISNSLKVKQIKVKKGSGFVKVVAEQYGYRQLEYKKVGTDTAVLAGTAVNEDLDVEASWKMIEYTLIYDGNGGEPNVQFRQGPYEYTELIPALKVNPYRKTIYVFRGWDIEETADTVRYVDMEENVSRLTVNDRVVLYAVWEKSYLANLDDDVKGEETITAEPRTVTLSANGGFFHPTFKSDNRLVDIAQGETVTFVEPEKAGYKFTYYTVTKNGTTKIVDDKWEYDEDGLTAVAQWEPINYSIVFDGGFGVTPSEVANQTNLTYGVSTPLNENQYSKKGYSFGGWTKAGGSHVFGDREPVSDIATKDNEEVLLAAKWDPLHFTVNRFPRYSIEIKEAIEAGIDPDTITVDMDSPIVATYGQEVEIENTADGFWNRLLGSNEFIGWVNPETREIEYARDTKILPNEDYVSVKNLLGWWISKREKSYSITFDGNGGTAGGLTSMTVPYSGDGRGMLPSAKKVGNTFIGWADKPTGRYRLIENSKINGSLAGATVYAKWQPRKYRLVYHSNNGQNLTSEVEELTYGANASKLVKSSSDFGWRKDGATFKYWSAQRGDGEGRKYHTGDSYEDSFEYYDTTERLPQYVEEIHLYAIWQNVEAKIVFHKNGGTAVESVYNIIDPYVQLAYGSDRKLPEGESYFSKDGYVFAGWSMDDGEGNTVKYGDRTLVDNVIRTEWNTAPADPSNSLRKIIDLYAVWLIKEDAIKVVYKGNGGRINGSKIYSMYVSGGTHFMPYPAVLNGNVHLGYRSSLGATIDENTIVNQKIIAYARWQDEVISPTPIVNGFSPDFEGEEEP